MFQLPNIDLLAHPKHALPSQAERDARVLYSRAKTRWLGR